MLEGLGPLQSLFDIRTATRLQRNLDRFRIPASRASIVTPGTMQRRYRRHSVRQRQKRDVELLTIVSQNPGTWTFPEAQEVN
jgi:hypothetical protein